MTGTEVSLSVPRSRDPVVLLVDDQPIVAELVRQMLSDHPEISLHYCADPFQALNVANQLNPTVILQDLVMPDIDGLTLVKFFRANAATRETPLVVMSSTEEAGTKAEAFRLGANDYLVKPPNRLELIARLQYHHRSCVNQWERRELLQQLAAKEQRLSAEMAAGRKYVESLLPPFLTSPVAVHWRFEPSEQLGGDMLGYFPVDDDHLALYLLDVTGHGLGSALLGVTVSNLLRARSLPETDFLRPAQVLATLGRTFQMEDHGDRFFTLWYGVFQHSTRRLCWSGAGHPQALLFAEGLNPPLELGSQNPAIGMFAIDDWEQEEIEVPPHSRLLIYSDGAFEIHRPDGTEWTFAEFVEFVSRPDSADRPLLDQLVDHCRLLKGGPVLDDDLSLLEVRL